MGVSRQEYWSGLPCPPPGDLPHPGIEPTSPALQADSSPSESPEEAHPSFPCFQTFSGGKWGFSVLSSSEKTWVFFWAARGCVWRPASRAPILGVWSKEDSGEAGNRHHKQRCSSVTVRICLPRGRWFESSREVVDVFAWPYLLDLWGCCNPAPKTVCLQTTYVCCCTVLKAWSPRWRWGWLTSIQDLWGDVAVMILSSWWVCWHCLLQPDLKLHLSKLWVSHHMVVYQHVCLHMANLFFLLKCSWSTMLC